jgi:AraC-like DNA-binding protein
VSAKSRRAISAAAIRDNWLLRAVVTYHRLADPPDLWQRPSSTTIADVSEALRPIQTTMPTECLLLRGLLLDVALDWSRRIHSTFHTSVRSDCRFAEAALAEDLWRDRDKDPIDLFVYWLAGFVPAFKAGHRLDRVEAAAAIIDADCTLRIRGPELAKRVQLGAADFRQLFRVRFGVSVSCYRRQRRVERAIELLRTDQFKVEAVAATVGYRSKKNFYKAIRAVTGNTPNGLRHRLP